MQIETSTNITPYGKIYRLTNKVNGKMYHGQTIEENINDRWNKYRRLECKSQKKLYNAIKKYGWDNFLAEVIDTTPQNQSQLDELEIFYIAKFDSINNGYNIMPGGAHGKHSEETKRKISNSFKGNKNPNFGKHRSDNTKQKISNTLKGKTHSEETKRRMSEMFSGRNHPMFGKHPSKETVQKISNSLKGRSLSNEIKTKISKSLKGKYKQSIFQLDLNGNIIKKWDMGLNDISLALKINKNMISKVLNNKLYKAGGFIWKYKPTNLS
jgi:hypothetical protein